VELHDKYIHNKYSGKLSDVCSLQKQKINKQQQSKLNLSMDDTCIPQVNFHNNTATTIKYHLYFQNWELLKYYLTVLPSNWKEKLVEQQCI